MARQKKHLHTRIVDVIEPNDPKHGLYRIYYQEYDGRYPIDDPYPADLTEISFKVAIMKQILEEGFGVPPEVIEEFRYAIREEKEESDSWND